jgi:hypothetical protein
MSFSLNTYVITTSTIAMIGTFLDFFKIDVTSLTGLVNKGGVKQVSPTETLGGGRKSKRRKYRKNASKKRR